MTNPGDQGDKPQSEASGAASPGGYEAPPIEHSHGQPSHQPQPGPTPPASDYLPPGGYPPPPGYPSAGAPPSAYGPAGYQDPSGYGAPSYPSQPQYGTAPGGGYPPPPPSYSTGYGAYPGGYATSQQGTNSLAIWSLVTSIVSIFLGWFCIGWLTGIAGVVLGVLALNQIKQTGQPGRGLAVAGIAVGAAALVISLIGSIYWFGSWSH